MPRPLALLGPLGLAVVAQAQPAAAQNCDELGFEPARILYGAASAALTPLLASLAPGFEGFSEEDRLTRFLLAARGSCSGTRLLDP